MPMIPKSEREEWRKACEALSCHSFQVHLMASADDGEAIHDPAVFISEMRRVIADTVAHGDARRDFVFVMGKDKNGEQVNVGVMANGPCALENAALYALARNTMPRLLVALDEAEARIRELEKEIEYHSQTWQVRRIEDLESEIRDLRSAHRQRIPR